MSEFLPLDTSEVFSVPPPWISSVEAQEQLQEAIQGTECPLLICDYDGTLAPFQRDKMQAYPFPGVVDRLQQIAAGRTRLAFVSGRPIDELITLLPLAAKAELWGMHGREHRTIDGGYRLMEPTVAQRLAFDQAQGSLQAKGLGALLERKAGSLALHWRTLEGAGQTAKREEVKLLALEVFTPYTGENALALLPFDGGMELRAEDCTKAHAINKLLDGAVAPAAAFLGDDTTDEDAFRAIRAQGGVSLLVREPLRPSYAAYSLKPPDELLAFFDTWIRTLAVSGSKTF